MKRLFLILCVAAAITACGDGGADGTSTDSTLNAPANGQDTTMLNDTSNIDSTTLPRDTMR